MGATNVSAAIAVTIIPSTIVGLTVPASDLILIQPTNLQLSALAVCSGASVAAVQFAVNGSVTGTVTTGDTNGNYAFSWPLATAGSYTLTAIATDSLGNTTTSAPVQITLDLPAVVELNSPTNGSVFLGPVTIQFTARATNSFGSIAQVEFLVGNRSVATIGTQDSNGFYVANWVPDDFGLLALSAKATDSYGISTLSPPVQFTVHQKPSVQLNSPGDGSLFQPLASITLTAGAAAPAGSISSVQFFVNGVNLATLANAASNGAYSVTWVPPGSGIYTVTANVTDNFGDTAASLPVQITVDLPPVVILTSPGDGAVFDSNTNLWLYASAADADGSIAAVQFLVDGVPISSGNATGSGGLYSIAWAATNAGYFTITAKATDDLGVSTVSTGVKIGINPPPGRMLNLRAGGGNKVGFAATGNTTNDYWNSIPAAAGQYGGFLLADSSPTPVTLSLYNVSGLGNNSSGDGMYDSYLFASNSSEASPPIFLLLGSLPQGNYDLFLYGHADPFPGLENDSQYLVENLGRTNGPLGTVSSTGWRASDPWVQGSQYVVFRDVVVGPSQTIFIHVLPGFNDQISSDLRHCAVFNGLQLVSKNSTTADLPPTLSILGPANNSVFAAFANILVTVKVDPVSKPVAKVNFFTGNQWLGTVPAHPDSDIYSFVWTNAYPGKYALLSTATDESGANSDMKTVIVTVLPTDAVPVVGLATTIRYAVEPETNVDPRNGVFTVTRTGDPSGDLTVFYTISGSATNGIGYALLPGSVIIPDGSASAEIVVEPINVIPTDGIQSVVLTLSPSPTSGNLNSGIYGFGASVRDTVYIIDVAPDGPPVPADGTGSVRRSRVLSQPGSALSAFLGAEGFGHVSVSGDNAALVVVEASSDFTHWTYLTHGWVANGQLEYLDPNSTADHGRFYRAVLP
jgi:hypothetical protein